MRLFIIIGHTNYKPSEAVHGNSISPIVSYPKPNPPGHDGLPGKYATNQISLELFDLEKDIHETNNVAGEFPEIVKKFEVLAEEAREDLGDSRTKRAGKNVREPGKI